MSKCFVGSIVLGPRMDRFKDESSKYISGHSIPLISLGGFILIFGFFAFNAGSQVKIASKYYSHSFHIIIYNVIISRILISVFSFCLGFCE